MPGAVDPAVLLDRPLMLGRIGVDDYAIRVAGLSLGRIMARPMAGGRVSWFWSLTGPYVPQTMGATSGDAESLDAAKAAIKSAFDTWLRWAQGKGEAVWHG